jgi:hypothetical protein
MPDHLYSWSSRGADDRDAARRSWRAENPSGADNLIGLIKRLVGPVIANADRSLASGRSQAVVTVVGAAMGVVAVSNVVSSPFLFEVFNQETWMDSTLINGWQFSICAWFVLHLRFRRTAAIAVVLSCVVMTAVAAFAALRGMLWVFGDGQYALVRAEPLSSTVVVIGFFAPWFGTTSALIMLLRDSGRIPSTPRPE